MKYICSLSGGVSSAVASDRTIKQHGATNVWLWFSDTLVEDLDLYRFVADCLIRWGNPNAARWLLKFRKRRPDGRVMTRRIGNFIYHTEGKTPEMIALEKQIIPNQKIAPCTYELKIKPFTSWLDSIRGQGSFCIALGYNVFEIDRIKKRQQWHRVKRGSKWQWRRPQGYQARFSGIYESYPLLQHPRIYDPFAEVYSWGVEIPALYREGFDNNNCGGECWRGGINHWRRLRVQRPARFSHKKHFEAKMQIKLDTNHAILRDQSNGTVTPLTLAELEEREEQPEAEYIQEDMFSCLCSY